MGIDAIVKPGSFADAGVNVQPGDAYQVRKVTMTRLNRLSTRPQVFTVDGDNLHLAEAIGADPIAVATQIRGRRYPFIPMQEGSRITRNFDRFYVKFLGDGNNSTSSSAWEGTFIASYGQTYVPPNEKIVGVQGSPGMARGIATATGVDLFRQAFITDTLRYGYDVSNLPAFLKRGGTIKIANMGGATLWIYFGIPGAFSAGSNTFAIPSELSSWPILPGASEEWRVESLLSLLTHGAFANNPNTLCAACSAGTCDYRVMVSSLFVDGTDTESASLFATDLS